MEGALVGRPYNEDHGILTSTLGPPKQGILGAYGLWPFIRAMVKRTLRAFNLSTSALTPSYLFHGQGLKEQVNDGGVVPVTFRTWNLIGAAVIFEDSRGPWLGECIYVLLG